ncbi:hypothetical protein NP493_484g03042 [Ridgeia piscesae]|uniref:Uncharacterized protein n=1 Tax=Ridgeia piscesae TaxID=27915 RepID=A0AAD9NSW6_RIDPI|nr:hypothetical protein NP493_484g03042 [Ridgeia piscesae]
MADASVNSGESDAVSVSTSSPSFSEIAEQRDIVSKRSQLATWRRRRQEKKKLQKQEERKLKNKICKDDFYNKSLEFKAWLHEYRYYRGVDALWAAGTPETQGNWAVPDNVTVTPGSISEETLVSKHSRTPKRTFSTFGKKSGSRAAEQLNQNPGEEIGRDHADVENQLGRKRHKTDTDRVTPLTATDLVTQVACKTGSVVLRPRSHAYATRRNTAPLQTLFDFS